MVPLLVTAALLVEEAPDELAPELPAELATDAEELPAALEELEVAVLLLLLQAAAPTTRDAATHPAVHLRMRI